MISQKLAKGEITSETVEGTVSRLNSIKAADNTPWYLALLGGGASNSLGITNTAKWNPATTINPGEAAIHTGAWIVTLLAIQSMMPMAGSGEMDSVSWFLNDVLMATEKGKKKSKDSDDDLSPEELDELDRQWKESGGQVADNPAEDLSDGRDPTRVPKTNKEVQDEIKRIGNEKRPN